MRLGSAVTITREGRTAPMRTVTLPVAAAWMGWGPGEAVGEGAGPTAAPPETAVTLAGPDRLSEMRLARATPFLVLASWGSMRPSVVKNWTIVPSGTVVPAGSVTKAVSTDIPPLFGMKSGLAIRVRVESGGAVMSAPAQVAVMIASAISNRFFSLLMVLLRPRILRRDRDFRGSRHQDLLDAGRRAEGQGLQGQRAAAHAHPAIGEDGDGPRARHAGGPRERRPHASGLHALVHGHRRAVHGQERARRYVHRLGQRRVVGQREVHPHHVLGTHQDD